MKKSQLIIIILLGLLVIDSCHMESRVDNKLCLVNLTSNRILVKLYCEKVDIYEDMAHSQYFWESSGAIEPGQMRKFYTWNSWEKRIEHSVDKQIVFYIFNADSVAKFRYGKMDTDDLVYDQEIYSMEELKACNWKIEYSGKLQN